MSARKLFLLLAMMNIASFVWAQGNACYQYPVWTLSGASNCGDFSNPTGANWIASEEALQAEFGGAGPKCSYTPNPYQAGRWYGECSSTGWTCKLPSPPVGIGR